MNPRSARRTLPHLVPILVVVTALALGACGSDSSFETVTGNTGSSATTVARNTDSALTKDGPVDGTRRMWIKPDLVDCVGEAPQKCMQVAESESGEYYFFYDQIGGFSFEEGTSYVLDVQVDEIDSPPADAGTLRYTLLEIIEQR